MDLSELKAAWQAYDVKLQQSLQLNLKIVEELGIQKVTSSFGKVIRLKIITIILGILWNVFLGLLIYRFPGEPVFVVSLAGIILINTIGIGGYIHQLSIISKINFRDPILETQRKLALLQASFIRISRILFFQAPFYATFFVSVDLLRNGGLLFWFIELSVLALLLFAAFWLYGNISIKNLDKPFVKTVIENEGGKAITKATEFIKEIEAYREEVGSTK
jgi:hypothetical protein